MRISSFHNSELVLRLFDRPLTVLPKHHKNHFISPWNSTISWWIWQAWSLLKFKHITRRDRSEFRCSELHEYVFWFSPHLFVYFHHFSAHRSVFFTTYDFAHHRWHGIWKSADMSEEEKYIGSYGIFKFSLHITMAEVRNHIPSNSDRDKLWFDRRMYRDYIDVNLLQHFRVENYNKLRFHRIKFQ